MLQGIGPSARRVRLGASLALVLSLGLLGIARADEPIPDRDLGDLLRALLPSVVRVQWRSGLGDGAVVERHAIVVDADGWLLMAGPRPDAGGTVAALFDRGQRAAGAEIWATDERTALTLLKVPLEGLKPAPLGRAPNGSRAEVARALLEPPVPSTSVLLVTAEGGLARGSLRGSFRSRAVPAGDGVATVELTCLAEAALAVVPSDLGAPFVDRQGRVLGLVIGADVQQATAPPDLPSAPRPEIAATYAVPGEIAAIVWPLLRKHRRVPRAALGALTRPVGPALSQHLCPGCGGHVVEDLAPGGPAARAGMQRHDVVHELEGIHVRPGIELSDALLPFRPGERLRLGVLRLAQRAEVTLVLGTTD